MPIITPPDPDERLLSRLGSMYDELDPVPDVVSEAARAAFILRDLAAVGCDERACWRRHSRRSARARR